MSETASAWWNMLVGMVAFVVAQAGCASIPPLPPRAIELNRAGAEALAAQDLDTADARLSLAVEYSPRFTEAWINLGYLELARGRLGRARSQFTKARDLNPDLPTPHHALGVLAERVLRWSEAEGHYRQALRVDPGFVPARANLARRLFARGLTEQSREQYMRLTQVAPASPEGYVGLVECLMKLGRDDEADEWLARARELFGDSPSIAMLVGRQLLARQAPEQAEQVFASATRHRDASVVAFAWAWIAVARMVRHDERGARGALEQALRFDANNPLAAHLRLAL